MLEETERQVMPTERPLNEVREVVGVFTSYKTLQNAIDELMNSGFEQRDISLLASAKAAEEKLGHKIRDVAEISDGPVPRFSYVSPEAFGAADGALIGGLAYVGAFVGAGAVVASGGAVAPLIAGAAGGAGGGLLGAALAGLLGAYQAKYFEEQISHGGLLLWARVWSAEHETRALKIFRANGAQHVHVISEA